MSAPQRRIRLGMVGGGQGSLIGPVHRHAADFDGHFELVAGSLSSTEEKARASAAETGIPPDRSYASYEEMAQRESEREDGIEAVSIVTPNHLHADPAIAFAKAGIDVICDKPLADTWESACRLRDAIKESGVCFFLTHNYSGYPLVREARSLVAGGKLGKVNTVAASYRQDWLLHDLENQGLKQAEWRTDPARSGPVGVTGDLGTHAYQILRYITGLELRQVAATLSSHVEGRQLDDHADMLLRYEGGAHGTLTCSQICVGHENDLTVAVYCENGSIRWAQENPNVMTLVSPYGSNPRLVTRGSGGLGEWAQAATRIPPGHPEGFFEAFSQLYRDAAAHIRARRGGDKAETAPLPDLADGLGGMAFADAAVRSSADNAAWTDLNDLWL